MQLERVTDIQINTQISRGRRFKSVGPPLTPFSVVMNLHLMTVLEFPFASINSSEFEKIGCIFWNPANTQNTSGQLNTYAQSA